MMNRWQFLKRLAPLMAMMALVLAACGREDLSTLNPQGPVAQGQFDLMKTSIIIMSIVVVIVFALSFYVIIRFRRRSGDKTIPKQVEGNHKLEIIWTVIPIILLVILGVPTVQSVFNLAKDYSKDPDAVKVIVTSHLYWWEFEYPELGIKTAQELVIPTGKTISIEAKTADVLHSFWVPSLAGKIDTNPAGNENRMYFSAPKKGVYLGKCAELCGPSHGLMDFKVKSVDPAAFDRWAAAIKAPVALPSDPALAKTFEDRCLSCHAVGDMGGPAYPNLTGIGSRESVGGILVNVEADDKKYEHEDTIYNNLYKWIKDPEAFKPGNTMPDHKDLTEAELKGIAEYLAGLKLDYE
ncbi:cytochrome c oxidase subunit II [Paenibacillus sp. GSMTC-2017]|uniref:cytochrome c oxidase subunit II n=1 Tax=Paenibacillus sp. GSMTC-2017 TaxID=2794350 RepID=UPI0018D9F36D|nr:cytochrome c oxidase subunit II [Paenibacillus sp. GSMTC-2017]MBH5320184.1 cytochrome c oxidase subunit II [Paenibacillus sp. GSMTC-2017]